MEWNRVKIKQDTNGVDASHNKNKYAESYTWLIVLIIIAEISSNWTRVNQLNESSLCQRKMSR